MITRRRTKRIPAPIVVYPYYMVVSSILVMLEWQENLLDEPSALLGVKYITVARLAILGRPRGHSKPSRDVVRDRIEMVRCGRLQEVLGKVDAELVAALAARDGKPPPDSSLRYAAPDFDPDVIPTIPFLAALGSKEAEAVCCSMLAHISSGHLRAAYGVCGAPPIANPSDPLNHRPSLPGSSPAALSLTLTSCVIAHAPHPSS